MTAIAFPELLRRARFQLSVAHAAQLPPDRGFEVAFAGRSNAGKSSALNAIAGRHRLAHASKTPGRTQLLNFFTLDESRRLVDLPGYGYARVATAVRANWQRALAEYFETRRSLHGLILVMDARHPLGALDERLLDLAQATGRPVHILLSKADKLSGGAARAACQEVEAKLAALGLAATAQLFSAVSKQGVEEVRGVLGRWLGFGAAGGELRAKKGPGNKGRDAGADK